jgi:hypothetical protein
MSVKPDRLVAAGGVAMASAFADNFTILGSIANLIVVQKARDTRGCDRLLGLRCAPVSCSDLPDLRSQPACPPPYLISDVILDSCSTAEVLGFLVHNRSRNACRADLYQLQQVGFFFSNQR